MRERIYRIFSTLFLYLYECFVNPVAMDLFRLLRGELRESLEHICPGLLTIYHRFDCLQDLVLTTADLLCGVAVTQCEGVVFDRLEINCDAEWCAQLVITSVPFADTAGRVIHFARNSSAAELQTQSLDEGDKGIVSGERNQEHLGRGDNWGE